MLTKETIAQIKESVSILQVCQQAGVTVVKNKICSPFTNEKTPSLHLYTESNTYCDFSDGNKGGDVISLYMGLHNLADAEFTTACLQLAAMANIPIPINGNGNPEAHTLYIANQKEQESLHLINLVAAQYYNQQLPKNAVANNYLTKERQYKPETIAFWLLGYDDGTLPQHLTHAGHQPETATKAGLLNEAGNSRFYKRVTFPIINPSGKTIGFTARIIHPVQAKPSGKTKKPASAVEPAETKPAETTQTDVKYLNTGTTSVFEKKAVLYGLYQNRKDIKGRGEAILVEGTTDVISLWQRGYQNAVATLDSNLTPERISLLKKYVQTIVLWRDADAAGQKAAVKDIAKLLTEGFTVKVIVCGSKDPAEWCQTARETEALPPAQEAIIWYAQELLPPTEGQPAERDKAIAQVAQLIACLPSIEQRGLYIEEVCKQHKIKPDYFYQKLKTTPTNPNTATDAPATGEITPPKTEVYEKRRLQYSDIKMFVRVGVNYFKWVVVTNNKTKKPELTLEKWSPEIIKQDYAKRWKSFLDDIPAYDTFCVRPDFSGKLQQSHIDQDAVSGMVSHNYNLCKPLTYTPAPGSFDTIKMFLTHIFGIENSDWNKQTEGDPLTMIIDCLRIKFQRPTHLLPVVCLLSREQETGKSTFFDFMADLFSSNAVTITKEHLESQFNTTYADRQIICAEEIKLTAKDTDLKNKLKHLATATKLFYNPKGVAQREIEYYGWLMMSSNHENDFLQLEETDKRFWITKLKTIEKRDPNLRQKMLAEIPAFAHYLLHTNIIHPQVSRMWFDPKHIENEQRANLIWNSRTALEKAITDAVTDVFLTYLITEENEQERQELRKANPNISLPPPEITFKCDMKALIDLVNNHSRFKHDGTQIKDWLRDNKGLQPGNVERFSLPTGYDETTDALLYRHGKGRIMTFVYFDWVTEEHHSSPYMKQLHRKLQKEILEIAPF